VQRDSSFGYDFSRVRIHNDAAAAQSAKAVNASVYTVGSQISLLRVISSC